jgi:hypothetical protein
VRVREKSVQASEDDEMSTATVTIPNIKVELTVEQLIAAVCQLEPDERARLAKALAETEMDIELARLIAELYKQPPIDDISDDEIEAEIRAVRQRRV